METTTLKSDLLQRKAEQLQALKELEKDIETIESIEKKYRLNGYRKVIHSENVEVVEPVDQEEPPAYPIGEAWPERFLFIIHELGHATSEEAGKKLFEYQPELGQKKAHKNAQLYLSSLYKKGEVKAKKVNGLYVYSL
jgi:hypothetical protein